MPQQRTEDVWHALSDDLLAFLRRRLPNDADAEDLLQETFLRVHDRLATLRNGERLTSWTYQIARNLVTDYFRGKGRSVDRCTDISVDMQPELIEADVENLNRQVGGWLTAEIGQLPETYQAAVERFEIRGMSQQHIADELGISLSAAKSRIQRGRELLLRTVNECCRFERDSRGNILDFQQHGNCQSCCGGGDILVQLS
jgi:RNA polymerase sigma-70 factor, ECF subfamily